MKQTLLKLFNNTEVTVKVANGIVEAQPLNSVVCVELFYINRFNKKLQSLKFTTQDGITVEQDETTVNYKCTILSSLHRIGWIMKHWTLRVSFCDEEGNNSFVREIDSPFRFVRPLEDITDTDVTIEVS